MNSSLSKALLNLPSKRKQKLKDMNSASCPVCGYSFTDELECDYCETQLFSDKLNIAIDFDQTLVDLWTPSLAALNKKFGTTYDMTIFYDPNFPLREPQCKDQLDFLRNIWCSSNVFENLEHIKGSFEGMRKLFEKSHKLFIITKRVSNSIRQVANTLISEGIFMPVYFTDGEPKDFYLIESFADVLIDDSLESAEEAKSCGVLPVVIKNPGNSRFLKNSETDYFSIDSIIDFVNALSPKDGME